ncbi:AGAP013138-PA [Anopheles gambiae str. PEST]|uniref:AGAP013138-PA n=3 Tax=gambiae species complex TaxID=44542 RepID=F5HIX8_ANOGA|nr:AGAP013138-PA [Anopheles gambiae str. PEST]
MSLFFFRLHNLQREEANKKRKKQQQQQQQQQQRVRQRRGAKVFRGVSCNSGISHLTLGPSRLFEKTPMSPSDSLDEIALQIPRYLSHK